MHILKIKLEGLTCGACTKLVQRMIGKIPGVKEVSVQLSGDTQIVSERLLSEVEVGNALKESEYKIV